MKHTDLVQGTIYQVKNHKHDWVLAVFKIHLEEHTYKGCVSINPFTMHHSKPYDRTEPAHTCWCRPGSTTCSLTVYDKDLQVRPASQESLDTINRLLCEIQNAEDLLASKRKELREFCC